MTRRQGFLAWMPASALFMLIGAFGPRAKVFGWDKQARLPLLR
jgi:hypothetical protein